MKKRCLVSATLLLASALAACGGGGGAAPAGGGGATSTLVEVAPPGETVGGKTIMLLKDLKFEPENLDVPKGGQVVFINEDHVARTVTKKSERAPGPDFDSGPLEPGATFSQIFDEGGEVEVVDTIRPDVAEATINVEDEEDEPEK